MNPFTTPDRLYISRRPQDMRAGIQRLASVVTTDFSMDPTDGALYCFVSRDCLKMKLLRFETNGWCMYYVRLAEGLIWLLDGIDFEQPGAPRPVAAKVVL